MSGCPTQADLKAYLLDELSADQGQAIDRHVAHCDGCEAAMAALCDELALGDEPTHLESGTGDATNSWMSPEPGTERFTELYSHATGGLGEIFVAHDQQLDRNVALKRMRARHARNQLSRLRFELEAEVTGKLEHPGIVPVYSKGADQQGRPFYVMRFIRGRTFKDEIDEFHRAFPDSWQSREARLQLQGLLRRLIDICNAVEYAHHRGVLHRDLKPANVMLGKFGETMIVDWGLAKTSDSVPQPAEDLADEEPLISLSGGSASGPTTMGSVVGTIGYMSPEQASGLPDEVGPASDIYSLGAILYRLLAGQSSQPPDNDKYAVLKRIERGEFACPRQWKPHVPRPLESICLKAMQRDPQCRYPTARAMARDIESYLADERVTAHRENVVERSFRLARRHRGLVATTIGLLLLGAATTVTIFAVRDARRSELQATLLHRKVRDVTDTWLTGAAEELSDFPVARGLRRELLQAAIQQFNTLDDIQGASGLPPLEVERGLTTLRKGELEYELGRFDDARNSYDAARTAFAKHRGDVAGELRLARSFMKLGGLAADQAQDAHSSYTRALAIYESLVEQDQQDAFLRDALGSCLTEIGLLHLGAGELQAAERTLVKAVGELERAVAIGQQTDIQAVDRDYFQQGLCYAQRALGDAILRQPAKRLTAKSHFEAALLISERLRQRHDGERVYIELHCDTRSYYANMLRTVKAFSLELDQRLQILAEYGELVEQHPFVIRYQESEARATMNLAQTYLLLERLSDAEASAEKAKTLFEKLVVREAALPRYHTQLAATLDLYAQILSARGNHAAAVIHCENAAGILSQHDGDREAPEQRQLRANNLRTWGSLLLLQGKHDEAAEKLDASVSLLEQLNSADQFDQYLDDLEKSRAARAAFSLP